MGQADMNRQPPLGSPGRRPALQFKVRRTVFRPEQRQFRQGEAAQPGTGRLQERFLGGEIGRGGLCPALAGKSRQQGLFRRCIHIVAERRFLQAFLDALGVTQIDSDAENHAFTT